MIIIAPVQRTLFPVGTAYLAHARRKIHKRTFDQDEAELEERQKKLQEEAANATVEDDFGVGDEPESAELLARDAKEWKVRPLCTPYHMSIFLVCSYR